MRTWLIGCFIGLFCWQAIGFAQDQPDNYQSLLWEIKGKGLKQPSYLYGTIHIIPADSFFVTKSVSKRIKKADRLVLEMKINMGAMLAAMKYMMLPKDQSLDKLLNEADFQLVQSFLQDSIKQALPGFERMKPIMISEHISSQFCMGKKQESYELHFSKLFREMKKPISGLETAKEQMSYLDGMSLEDQTQALMETVQDPHASCELYDEMVRLYRQEELGKLWAMTTADETMQEQLDGLLNQRNQNWIEPLEKMMKKESVFIAVGAAHLPGPQGVISLLQEAGYHVKPVK